MRCCFCDSGKSKSEASSRMFCMMMVPIHASNECNMAVLDSSKLFDALRTCLGDVFSSLDASE